MQRKTELKYLFKISCSHTVKNNADMQVSDRVIHQTVVLMAFCCLQYLCMTGIVIKGQADSWAVT